MKRAGKYTLRWLQTRRQWLKANPPAYDDSWPCGICGNKVFRGQMELDHIKKRSTNPELRFDLSNLRPAHRLCNQGRL